MNRAAASDSVASMNDVLQAQLTTLAEIEQILGQEHEALIGRDPEALLNAADAKTVLLSRLSELETRRRSLSEHFDAAQLSELQQRSARCRRINQLNAALLNTQQQHVNRLLSLLRGDRNAQPSAYDASGRTTGSTKKQLRLTQV